MSIEKVERGVYEVECDDCGEGDAFNADDWQDLMSQMKDDGWTKKKVDDEWEHYCPACSGNDDDSDDDEEGDE